MLSDQDQEKIKGALGETLSLMENGLPLNKEYSNEDLSLLYTLAYTLYQAEDFDQAKEVFKQLASSKPFEKKYWFGLGGCYQMKKSYTEALKAWAMAALIDGKDPTPHYHAAECYLSLKEYPEGKKAMRAATSRLTDEDCELRQKVKHLETFWNQKKDEGELNHGR